MKKRSDQHRRSALIPQDYEHVLAYCLPGTLDGHPDPGFNLGELARMMGELPFFSQHRGTCDSCGSSFRHGSVFRHIATGEHIKVGHECAEQIEGHSMTDSRKRDGLARLERARKRAALREIVKSLAPHTLKALRCGHHIVANIRANVIRFQNISCKQVDLVLKIAREEQERKNRPAERTVPAPVVEGKRVTVEGVVVSIKTHDGFRGPVEKITVKVETPAGVWLAWGSAPASLLDAAADIGGVRGCRVRFDAVLKAGRDAHFALFSRPTKGAIVKGGDRQRARLDELRKDLEAHEKTLNDAEQLARQTMPEFVVDRKSVWADQTRETISKIEELLK